MSSIDINASTTSGAPSEASTCLGHRRTNRRTRKKQSSSVEQSNLQPSVQQPSPSGYEATHDDLTLNPDKQPELQSNGHNPCSLNDTPDQPDEPNLSSLFGFMHECYNLPASYPDRPTQTVGLTFSSVGLTSRQLTIPPGSPLRHLVPPRDVTRKIVPPTEDTSYQQLLISLLPDRQDSLLILPLQLSKMMLMTSCLTLYV